MFLTNILGKKGFFMGIDGARCHGVAVVMDRRDDEIWLSVAVQYRTRRHGDPIPMNDGYPVRTVRLAHFYLDPNQDFSGIDLGSMNRDELEQLSVAIDKRLQGL